MPFIHTKTNIPIPPEKEQALKVRLGEAIALIPGKSENWLMLGFEENCTLYFKGDKERPLAFVEVKIFGSAPDSAYDRLTAAITSILQDELGITPDGIYVKYEPVEHWGWNGSNF